MTEKTTETLIFGGCEWGTFKNKAGVTDSELMLACEKMRSHFLNYQEGFIQHVLLKGEDGLWADHVFAKTQEDARRICDAFSQDANCLDYLALIDTSTVHLSFWKRVL